MEPAGNAACYGADCQYGDGIVGGEHIHGYDCGGDACLGGAWTADVAAQGIDGLLDYAPVGEPVDDDCGADGKDDEVVHALGAVPHGRPDVCRCECTLYQSDNGCAQNACNQYEDDVYSAQGQGEYGGVRQYVQGIDVVYVGRLVDIVAQQAVEQQGDNGCG